MIKFIKKLFGSNISEDVKKDVNNEAKKGVNINIKDSIVDKSNVLSFDLKVGFDIEVNNNEMNICIKSLNFIAVNEIAQNYIASQDVSLLKSTIGILCLAVDQHLKDSNKGFAKKMLTPKTTDVVAPTFDIPSNNSLN